MSIQNIVKVIQNKTKTFNFYEIKTFHATVSTELSSINMTELQYVILTLVVLFNCLSHSKSVNEGEFSDNPIDQNILGVSLDNLKPGEYGRPVFTPSSEEELLKEEMYKRYGYNQFVSEKISTHRSIPDFRDEW
jgi:hypothetical protein